MGLSSFSINEPSISSVPSNGEVVADEGYPEESSWTYYLQDFFQPVTAGGVKPLEDGDCSLSLGGSPSLISDAASMAAGTWPANKNKEMLYLGPKSSRKKLSFKKRRSRGVFDDDHDLLDTATSPVNSPKISEMKHFEEITAEVHKTVGDPASSRLETSGSTNQKEVCFGEEAGNIESSELRKRGLCLVSVTMLTNLM